MRQFHILFSKTFIVRLWSFATLEIALATLGGFWLVIDVISYFSESAQSWLKGHVPVWAPFILAFGVALWVRFPRIKFARYIAGTDICVEIAVTDIVESNLPAIVPCNTTFDTDIQSGIISPGSVQGQFTKKYFDRNIHLLDTAITNQLQNNPGQNLAHEHRRRGKFIRYDMGTVAKLKTGDGRNLYWLAMADINEHGNAKSDISAIMDSLAGLWQFLPERGDFEECIAIPIIGAGTSRVVATKEELIRTIIDSFIASSSIQKFCERLRICVSPKDYQSNAINMAELEQYLTVVCKYVDRRQRRYEGQGIPAEEPVAIPA